MGESSGILNAYADDYRLLIAKARKGLVRNVLKHAFLVLSAPEGVGFAGS
jgi:hypothetical protein